jgi:glycosyltransferase involved in cell wall biosynthesis
MVLAGVDFPPDVRVEKEARALRAVGHDVVVLCSSLRGLPAEDEWEGVRIRRYHDPRGVLKGLVALERALLGRDDHWRRIVLRAIRELDLDVLHVHDLPVLRSALAAASAAGIPCVADLHENFPAAIAQLRQHQTFPRSLLRFVDSPARWEHHELTAVSGATAVIVVVEEAADRLAARGVPREHLIVVGNTEDVDSFAALRGKPVERSGDFVVLYAGAFGGRHRGLDTLVDAMPELLEHAPEAVLMMVGDGPERKALERRVRELGVAGSVRFEGWQPFERMPAYMAAADVCVVPHRSTPHTESTIPHKLFQYMLAGRPVVVSDCAPLRRVVEKSRAGEVFAAGDAHDLVRALLRLRVAEVAERAGTAGRTAVLEHHNWERSSRALLEVYARLDRRG